MSRILLSAGIGAALALPLVVPSVSAAPGLIAIYDNIPHPTPGSTSSLAFDANGRAELGDRIAFEPGTSRKAISVKVLMSDFKCETGDAIHSVCQTTPGTFFEQPIKLNIYAVGPSASVGTLLLTQIHTFEIPYRPSSDPACPGVAWFDQISQSCRSGFAVPIVFDVGAVNNLGVTLPDEVIISIGFNTTRSGYEPIGTGAPCYTSGAGCGYDYLNWSVVNPATFVTAGSNPAPTAAYQYTVADFRYCDGGSGGVSFRLDAGCWTVKPAMTVFAESHPALSLSPASHDFGSQAVSTTSAASTFTLSNDGNVKLNITDVLVAGL